MKIEQIYTGCLAEAAYYIESNGEAAIIDPMRDAATYLEKAENDKAKIKFIFETHFHADFISGHIDLAKESGASIVYGPTTMDTGFEKIVGSDGQIFKVGNITLELLHTPGHTMESSCFLLRDEKGIAVALFSGDTLFIGDVGRPDLAQKVIPDLTQDILAGHLFDSLRNKIMPLNDEIIVYPNHGQGSACGKNMSSERSDTLGNQKKTNYALRPNMTKEEFKTEVLTGLMPPPAYFPQNVLINIQGYESLDKVITQGSIGLNPNEFERILTEKNALIIDTRSEKKFVKGFVPGSIFIGIDGSFATWLGTLVPEVKQAILIVAEEDRVEEIITRMARVGFDNAQGYLKGGMKAWKEAAMSIETISSIAPEDLMNIKQAKIIDVRKDSEFKSEHIVGATNAPLDYLNKSMNEVTNTEKNYIHCAGGYRSLIFISILQSKGYKNLVNVNGGFNALKESNGYDLTKYTCPATHL